MTEPGSVGHIVSINVSRGGVPKLPIPRARVGVAGVEGDAQNDLRHHGGPDRAVCIFSMEVIERLRAEGHPIGPGAAGENLTIAGLDWPGVVPGAVLAFEGGVQLEVVSFCSPCKTIREAFTEGDFGRISQKLCPGESRVYARVLVEGEVREGDAVRLDEP